MQIETDVVQVLNPFILLDGIHIFEYSILKTFICRFEIDVLKKFIFFKNVHLHFLLNSAWMADYWTKLILWDIGHWETRDLIRFICQNCQF